MKTLEMMLKEKGYMNPAQWEECVQEARQTAQPLTRVLVERNIINEDELLTFLGKQLGLEFARLEPETIDARAAHRIPSKFVTHYNFMPLGFHGDSLRIAVNDPLDILKLDEIRLFLNQEIEIVLARRQDIIKAVRNAYGLGAETLDDIDGETEAGKHPPAAPSRDISPDEGSDPSVIKFLNQVLLDAIKQRATDIHFEPFENDLRIRYRIDGILYEVSSPATIKTFQSSIASRIKIMASLDIAEKRRPQDGRVDVKLEGHVYDLRISIMPTPFGESIGIRILPRTSMEMSLAGLGLAAGDRGVLETMVQRPHGIILVTGPTGSGKTSTLYACLSTINSAERKILTIEDPIEYQLKGITQMQVDPKIGFSFANALRSMLRHDPDCMMVGEIRDAETAELAIRTALTGHLVLSTLHTNDAAGGVTRLLDMGIDAFLVSSSVNLIIAQRLVRMICPGCKQKITPAPELLKQFPGNGEFTGTFFHGSGCEQCRFTGYKERSGIFETLVITDAIRDLILKRVPSHVIREEALKSGTKLLKDAGWEKITAGLTTVEEVLRVTQEN